MKQEKNCRELKLAIVLCMIVEIQRIFTEVSKNLREVYFRLENGYSPMDMF